MLPNLNLPEFVTTLPSDKREVFFRPFLVKEEKILLMALESGDSTEIENAIIKILCNCVKLDDQQVMDLPSFDIEHLFLQIRSKSVSDIVSIKLGHQNNTDCEHKTDIEININDIVVDIAEEHTNKLMLNESIGIVMKYPSLRDSYSLGETLGGNNVDSLFDFIANGVEYVFDENEVYEDATHADKIEFIESVNKDQFEKILEFYSKMPTVVYKSSFICEKCSAQEDFEIRGINNFF